VTKVWRAAFGLSCAVQLYALYSPAGGPELFPYSDKVVHVLLFAAVAFTGRRVRLPAGRLAVVLVLNAVVSELVQHVWLSRRSGDPYDALADVIGVLIGLWFAGGRLARTT
jgi:hypothetical protein